VPQGLPLRNGLRWERSESAPRGESRRDWGAIPRRGRGGSLVIRCWSLYTGGTIPHLLRRLGARPGFGRASAFNGSPQPGTVYLAAAVAEQVGELACLQRAVAELLDDVDGAAKAPCGTCPPPRRGLGAMARRVAVDLTPQAVEQVAQRVAQLLGDRARRQPELITAGELARRLRVERPWIYKHRHLLGGQRIGDGPKAPWRFDLDTATQALGRMHAAPGSAPGPGEDRPLNMIGD